MSAVDASVSQAVPQGDFFWEIGAAEEKRLSTLLDVDFSTLNIKGTFVTTPKRNCRGCGKLSGLDDFVATALSGNVHTKEFMKKALSDEDVRNNPEPHYLICAGCGGPDPEPTSWTTSQNWRAKRG
ncbi:hypothetical protein F4820DRAFT_466797 [Hypoxylon rubiginosum]|uniref:Uncharacterized protein n=1 Tax=Hypoxylon rubiginosum TaxID=110542 RepID=A0ACB9YKJ2_9PEZI|nr:hypothetical protein F4820DRAFT_466797 [Hypoxylon rubiginosum]